ncbi:hypothetical protein DFJ73DRAFT_758655 [Zopfochytrium polystomum]|nr:hypothetical protein DFJ73DRAFT_758655 [Zopfochytrium polystomum]
MAIFSSAVIVSASLFISNALSAHAQFVPGGPTQPGLPSGCLGSYPNDGLCQKEGWHLTPPDDVDPCKPDVIPLPGQQVYIQDQMNFCINLPNPDSIYLKQQGFYSNGKLPSIVQAEGYVQSYCFGSYLPAGSKPLPSGTIRSAHVIKNFTNTGTRYIQLWGTMDCGLAGVDCNGDGGQYDSVNFVSCGKEPYSGVDPSRSVNGVDPTTFKEYIQQAGNGIFCMRICEGTNWQDGMPCDARKDEAGCYTTMGITSFDDGFTYLDITTGASSSTSVSLPKSSSSSTTSSSTKSNATVTSSSPTTASSSGTSASVSPSSKSSAGRAVSKESVALLTVAAAALQLFLL